VLFLNDDVRPLDGDWLEAMVEYLQQPGVGAVAPKLVYPNGTLQHAGMVTGVRNLVGTAFHTFPAASPEYFGLAQCPRNASALSAACLLMRRSLFEQVGGYDEANTPIMHSDFDLSFKIREAGLRLVYTPFAALEHIGHVSIGKMEREGKAHSEKADVFLLKRWGRYIAHDPFFTDNMRDMLYVDSPRRIRVQSSGTPPVATRGGDILVASHEMTLSGAPIVLAGLVQYLSRNHWVAVVAPEGGPLTHHFVASGAPVFLDELATEVPEAFAKLVGDFDLVIANTILHWRLVLLAKRLKKPVLWLIHESEFGASLASSNPSVQEALAHADRVAFPSTGTMNLYRQWSRGNQMALPCGIEVKPPMVNGANLAPPNGRLRLVHVGSLERRKGQDILVEAFLRLSPEERDAFEIHFLGRILDRRMFLRLLGATAREEHIYWLGQVSQDEVLRRMERSDVFVCTSRDETGPLVAVEAMALGKPVLTTPVGLMPELFRNGENGFLLTSDRVEAVTDALRLLLRSRASLSTIGAAGRSTWLQRLTLEKYGESVERVLRELLPASVLNGR
jgi:glycosyltransferase involved in cell wall biosynthesis